MKNYGIFPVVFLVPALLLKYQIASNDFLVNKANGVYIQ